MYSIHLNHPDSGTTNFHFQATEKEALAEAKDIIAKRNKLGNKFKKVTPTYGWAHEWLCKESGQCLFIKELL